MMTERRFNYPKHPLFGIAPLLFNWRGDVNHDAYTSNLVGRIRAGRYTPELFDANSLYLDYPERSPIAAAGPRIAVKSRYTMTLDERRAWNNGNGDPEVQAERVRRKEEAAKREAALEAERAERAEAESIWQQKKAERERRKATLDAEWRAAGEAQRLEREARAILTNLYRCACGAAANISPCNDGYVLKCQGCGKEARASHATFAKIFLAAA